MGTFTLEIMTPEKLFFKDEVEAFVFPSSDGEVGVLRTHAPMVASVAIGELRIKQNDAWRGAFVSEGFLEVMGGKCVMFTQAVEWPEDIDAARAKEAMERAGDALRQARSLQEYKHFRVSLTRAMVRLRVTKDKTDYDS